jgi:hypothetical protein
VSLPLAWERQSTSNAFLFRQVQRRLAGYARSSVYGKPLDVCVCATAQQKHC